MWLTRIAIDRRVSIAMAILAVIVLGIVGLSRMPWAIRPDVDVPVVTVTVPYPGAGPEEIEQTILKPLEDEASVINGVDEVEATAYENIGTVSISFDYEVDIDVAAADVRDALSRAEASFPDEAKDPSLYKIDINAMPLLVVGITGDRSPRELRDLVEDRIEPRLGQVAGVASVTVTGGETREIQVRADKQRLNAAGISISQLARMIKAESIDVPAGSIQEGKRDYALRVTGEFETVREIRNLRLTTPAGEVFRVHELATVLDTITEPDRYARIDGDPSIRVAVTRQSDANTVQVANQAQAELEQLVGPLDSQGTGELPSDIRATIARDDSREVVLSILDVRNSLIYGALLAGVVVFFALNNFRGTLIVCLAIPTSLLCGFLPIGIGFQFTLNTMVMLGLALVVGTLVDDSIVVLENIDRHRKRGEAPKAAAFNGRTEISGAAFGTTAVDTVVFVPVALMGGVVGQFFYPFGMTVVSCSVFSLLMAFTLTPMLASWWYQRIDQSDADDNGIMARMIHAIERAFDAMRHVHRAILVPAVSHPYITLIVGYALMAVVVRYVTLPFEFFPETDQGQVNISVERAVGTRLQATDKTDREIEKRLQDRDKYPAIEHVSSVVGSASGGMFGATASGGRYGYVTVNMIPLNERRRKGLRADAELAATLRKNLSDLLNVTIEITTTGGMGGGGGGDDIQLNILSENEKLMHDYARNLKQKISKIDGLRYVELSAEAGRPEIHADIDRMRAAEYDMSVAEIGNAVRTAFEGDTSAYYRQRGEEYDIRVQLAEFDQQSVSDFRNLFIGTHNRQPVYLGDVADIYMATGPSSVERYNRQRKTTLSAALDPSVIRSGTAQEKINEIIQQNPRAGVTTAWTGQIKMQQESFGRIGSALALSVILVYIVLAILYNSVLEPLNIISTLPMAIIGGLIALKLSGHAISVVAMIGFIMLMGLVGKNAIYMVDYIDVLRGRQVERTKAILEAAPTRLRPVIMTTITTVLAMLPTALSRNEGAEWRAPMAWTVIGGMLFSTLLSLVVVPATYAIWHQVGIFFTRLGIGLAGLLGITHGADDHHDDDRDEGPPPPDGNRDQQLPPSPDDGHRQQPAASAEDTDSAELPTSQEMPQPPPRRIIGQGQQIVGRHREPDLSRVKQRRAVRKPSDRNFR